MSNTDDIIVRKPKVAARREAIREAAFALIRKQGFEKTTMLQVAEAAGVSRATVFNHFASKEALLAEAHTVITGAIFDSEPDAGPSGILNLRRGLRRICEACDQERNLSRAILVSMAGSQELQVRDREDEDDLEEWIVRALEHSRQCGEIPTDLVTADLAGILIAILSSSASDWVAAGARHSMWSVIEPRFEIMVKLLHRARDA